MRVDENGKKSNLDFELFQKRVKTVEWDTFHKAGRYPINFSENAISRWKGMCMKCVFTAAEEMQKFGFPLSRFIFASPNVLTDDRDHKIFSMIWEITHLLYSGRGCCTGRVVDRLHQRILALGCLIEEIQGVTSCTISLHNMLHVPADIRRFGAVDNYWCYSFERLVRHYVQMNSNNKSLER
jgi:hypothetical protein